MNDKNARWYIAVAIGIVVFFLSQWWIFGPLHEALFLSHTSIQNNVEECVGVGAYRECSSEDDVRAYNNFGWAIFGNTVAFIFLVLRASLAYVTYWLLRGRIRSTDVKGSV